MSQAVPHVACLITHRVADYDAWKKAFDDHTPARKEGTCTGHHINRGADDPNMVYIYSPATDLGKLVGFLNSAELPTVMRKAGVDGPAHVTLMKPMSTDFIPDKKLPGILVTHEVEDYAKWRAGYDAFDAERKKMGIIGHAVNQEVDKPNKVIVYHQAKDMDALRKFVNSARLKEVMQDAGVVGAPEIDFVQVADFGDY